MIGSPQRMCMACRVHTDKAELFRIVRGTNGNAVLDEQHKLPGRGAYLCKKTECIRKAEKNRAISRALSIPAEENLYKELIQQLDR